MKDIHIITRICDCGFVGVFLDRGTVEWTRGEIRRLRRDVEGRAAVFVKVLIEGPKPAEVSAEQWNELALLKNFKFVDDARKGCPCGRPIGEGTLQREVEIRGSTGEVIKDETHFLPSRSDILDANPEDKK